jgi:hypothetical protein
MATELLTNGMQQSDGPVAQLSGALIRMAQTLSDIGTPLFATGECQPESPLRVFRDTLARDVAVCIQSLQFHDRLTQQLTLARDLLTGTAPENARSASLSAPVHGGSTDDSVELF